MDEQEDRVDAIPFMKRVHAEAGGPDAVRQQVQQWLVAERVDAEVRGQVAVSINILPWLERLWAYIMRK